MQACRRGGLRGILLSHFAGQVPKQLPDGLLHVAYAPFGSLLPRLAAFVHHGGIGSTAQALKAGVPQLIRPVAYDQFDNSARAVQLGTAVEVPERAYEPTAVAATLKRLVADTSIHARCAAIAQRLEGTTAVVHTCDVLLRQLAT